MACRHPRDKRIIVPGVAGIGGGYYCTKCQGFVSKEKSLRGKRANRRGRRESARIAKDIGGKNHEVEGQKYDVTNDLYVVQSKKDKGLFSERHWRFLSEIPREGGRTPVLIVKDAPGPGTKVRGYAVMTVQDFNLMTGVKG